MATDTYKEYTPRALTTNEQAANGGMTHEFRISANSLTDTTNAEAQTFTICNLKAGDILIKLAWRCTTFFKDASDTGFNTTTMSVGDNTSVTHILAAIEVNENGAVRQGFTNTAIHYTAADKITVTFNSMTGKNLNNIDVGEVFFEFQILRPQVLSTSETAPIAITK